MDLGIKGRRALVLASSRGLGKGIAVALGREGVDVLAQFRRFRAVADHREVQFAVRHMAVDIGEEAEVGKPLAHRGHIGIERARRQRHVEGGRVGMKPIDEIGGLAQVPEAPGLT